MNRNIDTDACIYTYNQTELHKICNIHVVYLWDCFGE